MSTDIIVALVTGLCTIAVAAVTWVQNRRGDLSEAYRRLSEAQLNMQQEIDRLKVVMRVEAPQTRKLQSVTGLSKLERKLDN